MELSTSSPIWRSWTDSVTFLCANQRVTISQAVACMDRRDQSWSSKAMLLGMTGLALWIFISTGRLHGITRHPQINALWSNHNQQSWSLRVLTALSLRFSGFTKSLAKEFVFLQSCNWGLDWYNDFDWRCLIGCAVTQIPWSEPYKQCHCVLPSDLNNTMIK